MQHSLEAALDKLVSPRSSLKAQADALSALERVLAELLSDERQHLLWDSLTLFLRLQDSFQCNIVSRTLSWLAHQTHTLKKLGDEKDATHTEEGLEAYISVIVQALSLLQGMALIHRPSKDFLGRAGPLEAFIDLLSAYRHASTKPFSNTTNASSNRSARREQHFNPSLATAVLDTLLCVLVDSPPAIRAFEEVRGVELVVKILKRSAIPKDVRMKCLEFLYFYLMDESSPDPEIPSQEVPTRPSSPQKPGLVSGLLRSSRYPTASSLGSSADSGPFPRTGSSASSSSSWSPTPTLAGTPPQSPTNLSNNKLPQIQGQVRGPLAMLRKDVDFVPLSPKKAQVAQLGLGNRQRSAQGSVTPPLFPSTHSSNPSQRWPSPLGRMTSGDTLLSESDASDKTADVFEICERDGPSVGSVRMRTTEEKKELLGQLLGNVDALVEGVRKAGIWGLGD
ncbi:hypothetical protein M0805_007304 [Coniferiporia weirii]|nr:hypothetical protein M0805_007304 [Coniferiporia weirii]